MRRLRLIWRHCEKAKGRRSNLINRFMRSLRSLRSLAMSYLIISFFFVNSLFALDLGFAKDDGGQPGSMLEYGASARAMAMGRAHTGLADDASAPYWNPAGLSQIEQKDLVTLYSVMEEKTGYGFVSYAQPTLDLGNWGFSLINLQSRDFEKRDADGLRLGTFNQDESAVYISQGFRTNPKWGFGSTIKVIRQEIDSIDGIGYGADAGLMWFVHPRFQMGLTGRNLLAPKVELKNSADRYPTDFRGGIKLQPHRAWLIAMDLAKTPDRSLKIYFGTELLFKEMVQFRVGLNESEITAGVGIALGDWNLDYAFGYNDAVKGFDDLGAMHRFGFHVKFGEPIYEQKGSARLQRLGKTLLAQLTKAMDSPEMKNTVELKKAINQTNAVVRGQGYVKPADLYTARGYLYYFEDQYEKSVQALGEALSFDPENSVLKKHFERVKALVTEERVSEIVRFEKGRAKRYYEEGNYRETVRSCKTILTYRSDDPVAKAYLEYAKKRIEEPIQRSLKIALAHFDQGEFLEAMKHLVIVKEMDPTNQVAARYMSHSIAALKKQASIQYQMNNPKKPVEVYEIHRNPAKSQEFYSQGLMLYSQGNIRDALKLWEKSVRLDDTNSMAKNAYNRALLELEEKEQ